ncbi:MAG: glycerophosphodiester phosphodiesterase [Hyphomicrobiaceae bacterium]|nr:MAG: glycerophosphodiester phosphodiesterase [Hyphomicrobiaceae bacterium]
MSAAVDLVRPIAHRGLHNARLGVVENTESAFKAAIAKGYGIECDLQPASDFEPMVFHDERLVRLTTASGLVSRHTPSELKRIPMRKTSDRMMRLSEMLEMVAGAVPLLIEVKSDWARSDDFAVAVAKRLRSYKGPYGIMSFDPNCVQPFRALLPHAPRGIVAGGIRSDLTMPRWIRHWNARKLLSNDIARPDFINYFVRGLPAACTVLGCRPEGLPLFTWTVRSMADRAKAARYADAMVFEGFEPEPGVDYRC